MKHVLFCFCGLEDTDKKNYGGMLHMVWFGLVWLGICLVLVELDIALFIAYASVVWSVFVLSLEVYLLVGLHNWWMDGTEYFLLFAVLLFMLRVACPLRYLSCWNFQCCGMGLNCGGDLSTVGW